MVDNVTTNPGSGGAVFATDDIAGVQHTRVKVQFGVDGSATDASATDPLPVTTASLPLPSGASTEATLSALNTKVPAQGQAAMAASAPVVIASNQSAVPVSGTVTANAGTGPWPVTDNGGSLTVDGTVGVSGTVTVTGAVDTELTTGNVDTGAGTDTRAVVGLVGTASGGGQLIPGSSTDGLLVNLGANNDVTVTGSVTANVGTGPYPITDNAGSLTVDNAGTFAVQAAQSGTWTVQPGNTANTVAWKVDASSVAVPITDNAGSLTVDNAGTFATQESQLIADNGAFTDGTSKVFPAGFVYDEVAGTALTENDVAAGRVNVNRAMVHAIEDGATRGRYATVTAANSLKVDGSAVTQPVSGTFWQATQPVSGTVSANATLAAETTKVIGTVNVAAAQTIAVTSDTAANAKVEPAGNVAHDAADSGNPLKVGAKAIASAAGLTMVATGDRTNVHADLDGAVLAKPIPNGDIISERIADTSGTSTAFTNFGAVAGARNYVRAIHVYNSSATDGFVDFRDGVAGAVLFTAAAPAGGGMTLACDTPLFRTSVNTALAYDVSAAITTVYINVSGHQSKA